MKQNKSSIKRVSRGRRVVAEHPELMRGTLLSAFRSKSFGEFMDAVCGKGRWSTKYVKGGSYKPAPNYPGSVSVPDKVWVRCPSKETASDILRIMGAEELDNSFSKFVNVVKLEDDGRTIYAAA